MNGKPAHGWARYVRSDALHWMCTNFFLAVCGRLGATRAHTREVCPPCIFQMPLTDEISPDVDPISEGAAAADHIVKTTVPPERSSTPDRDMSRSTTLDPTTSSSSRMTPDTQRRTSLFPYMTLSPPIPQAPKEEVKPDVSTIYNVTPSVSGTRGTSTTGSSGPRQLGAAQLHHSFKFTRCGTQANGFVERRPRAAYHTSTSF